MVEEDSPGPADLQGLHNDSPKLSYPVQFDATEQLGTHKSLILPWLLTGIRADNAPFGEVRGTTGVFKGSYY